MSVTRAWGLLLALSAGSTLLAASGLQGRLFAVPILVLSGTKAHVILARYLGLAAAPRIRAGFDLVLGAVLVLFTVLASLA
ncbi:MAG: nitric oxide reductase F protein [Rhodobacteraceae bacterium]|nr:nitric oxide reductase F protein [Paracoccaceae bacterium]